MTVLVIYLEMELLPVGTLGDVGGMGILSSLHYLIFIIFSSSLYRTVIPYWDTLTLLLHKPAGQCLLAAG